LKHQRLETYGEACENLMEKRVAFIPGKNGTILDVACRKGERLGFFAFVLDLERSCGIKFDDTLLNHEHLRSIRSAAALMNSLHAASETENSAGVGGTNFADRNRKWFYEQSERSRRCCGVPLCKQTGCAADRTRRPALYDMMNSLLVILGPPRSFTTIVSGMLGQHPQMYGLPEVHLFGAETMAEWWRQCAEATFNMDHGLVRVVAQLFFGDQSEDNVRRAAGWLQRRAHLTTGLLVETLAERLQPRILVDKSPSIVYRVETLRRVYAMFPQARFLHLVRHPRGQRRICDEVPARAEKTRPGATESLAAPFSRSYPNGGDSASPSSDIDPQRSWLALHRNICEFLEGVPARQTLRVRGEDIVGGLKQGLREVLAWLGLRTDDEAIDEMKHPERSPYACYGPASARFGNDPRFSTRPGAASRARRKAQPRRPAELVR
jgi:hypothetical protein